ncbi:MAG TPA: signal peptidase I [Anaerolineaceae bacterium]|nr:signal peptidase I [Anaerolineaceae bacterium]
MENFRSEEITEPVPQPKSRPGWLTFLLETLQTIILAVVLYFLIDSVVARVRVENISMEPTLMPGEFILVNKLAFKLNDIHRGDIIVFHFPQNQKEDYIKRVIGLAGDTITVRADKVYVNDQEINEPYIAAEPAYNGTWQVPAGAMFVLGDNRNQSSDSHSWGFVPDELIVGKALVIYWPLDQFKTLSQPIVVNAKNGP